MSTIVTIEAGADLSAARGKAVKISTGKVVTSAAAANYVPVCVAGECYGLAGAAIAIGALLISNGSGELIATTATTDFIVGVALEAADADGDLILINVNLSNVGGS
mgnify:CR=1 FL=1